MSIAEFEISTDRARLDLDVIEGFLTQTYWASGRSRTTIATTIENSVCFGGYLRGQQVAFCRLVTDTAVVAYLLDVFVLPQYRGNGYGHAMVAAALGYTDSRGIASVSLKTRDASWLYEKFGFAPLGEVHGSMRRTLPENKLDAI